MSGTICIKGSMTGVNRVRPRRGPKLCVQRPERWVEGPLCVKSNGRNAANYVLARER
jgi:hypothetical protein